jgi:hypothetical protein
VRINRDEIIEDIERHIRKFGGERSEWCVGTAKDARSPFFQRHSAADLGDELTYREAFTTTTADEAVAHLVNACGLKLAPEAEPNPTLPEAIEPGRIVFVYRQKRETGYGIRDTGKEGTAPPSPLSEHAAFPRRAA